MARPLRKEYAGALWHITSRGNHQDDIVRNDADRREFVSMLGKAVKRFGWRLYAWVLMDNHFHLLVETPEPTLSRGMQWLKGKYAQKFNATWKLKGHLFEGRFHGFLVEKESYLLNVARYIVLNPVRALEVSSPDEYDWSSYRATAGLDKAPDWLDARVVLDTLDPNPSSSRKAYRHFVLERIGKEDKVFAGVVDRIYLGSAAFVESVERRFGIARVVRDANEPEPEKQVPQDRPVVALPGPRPTLEAVLAGVAGEFGIDRAELGIGGQAEPTAIAAWLATRDGLCRLREVADALGYRSPGYVSTLAERIDTRCEKERVLERRIEQCRKRIRSLREHPPPSRAP